MIDVLLNDYAEGVRIDGQYGSTYEGDGDKWRTSINFGVPLATDGFFNMTAEYRSRLHLARHRTQGRRQVGARSSATTWCRSRA